MLLLAISSGEGALDQRDHIEGATERFRDHAPDQDASLGDVQDTGVAKLETH